MQVKLEMSVHEAAQKLKEDNVLLLDVRTPQEHALVALPKSVLIPLYELEARVEELAPFKEQEVIVYCHHGVRSLAAAQFLQHHGFQATSVQGGIDAYSCEVEPHLQRY